MLRNLKGMMNYVISARDAEIGPCKDFLFDDEFWIIRYIVADTGKWLSGRKVLIPPVSLAAAEWDNYRLWVDLTKEQIENSPPLDEHAPVSREYETEYFNYYHWPFYWTGADVLGAPPHPPGMPEDPVEQAEGAGEAGEKTFLRSVKETAGYDIRGIDGDIGNIEDHVMEDDTWTIRYLVVDTGKWLPGRKVLVAPHWIDSVNWAENTMLVGLTTKQFKESPEYNPAEPVDREYEIKLHDFYGRRPGYWT